MAAAPPKDEQQRSILSDGNIWAYIVPYTRGKVLHIGGGRVRLYAHWQTLDSGKGKYGGNRIADFNQAGTDPIPIKDGTYDSVVAGEDLPKLATKDDLEKVLTEWHRLVAKGGYFCLTWPHPDGPLGKEGTKVWPIEVIQVMRKLGGWDLVEDSTEPDGVYWQVYRLTDGLEQNAIPWRKKEKSVLVVRYGAFGDAIHASSVLPWLKRQGWSVTVNSHPTTMDVLRFDPHIERFIVQDPDQVPNQALGAYWAALGKRFDRTINFSEAAEGVLLTTPGSLHDMHTDEARRRLYWKQSYLARLHDIADVPPTYEPKFYTSPGEIDYVKEKLKDVPRPWVLWVMSGSSFHKVLPYIPPAIVRLMYRHPTVSVILAGGKDYPQIPEGVSQAVVDYHGHGHRLIRTDGVWPIRGTMTLAQLCDVVVGPETGVLNSVAMEPVPKVCLLSHSSAANLTDDWVNVRSVTPPEGSTPCYP